MEVKKELHRLSEEKKEARHKEKMAIRIQFLQLLNARLNIIDAAAQATTSDCNINNATAKLCGPGDFSRSSEH